MFIRFTLIHILQSNTLSLPVTPVVLVGVPFRGRPGFLFLASGLPFSGFLSESNDIITIVFYQIYIVRLYSFPTNKFKIYYSNLFVKVYRYLSFVFAALFAAIFFPTLNMAIFCTIQFVHAYTHWHNYGHKIYIRQFLLQTCSTRL